MAATGSDDPRAGKGSVASYYAEDAFEITADGDGLFEAVRLNLEERARDLADYREDNPEEGAELDAALDKLAALRAILRRFATDDRPETGEEYFEKYLARSARARRKRTIAATQDGMGIVVHPELYRPLSVKDKSLWRCLWKEDDPLDLVEQASHALREGFPGTALKLGKELWAVGGEKKTAYAFELLDAAYTALAGRDVLCKARCCVSTQSQLRPALARRVTGRRAYGLASRISACSSTSRVSFAPPLRQPANVFQQRKLPGSPPASNAWDGLGHCSGNSSGGSSRASTAFQQFLDGPADLRGDVASSAVRATSSASTSPAQAPQQRELAAARARRIPQLSRSSIHFFVFEWSHFTGDMCDLRKGTDWSAAAGGQRPDGGEGRAGLRSAEIRPEPIQLRYVESVFLDSRCEVQHRHRAVGAAQQRAGNRRGIR